MKINKVFKLVLKLGISNVLFVIYYKYTLKFGFRKKKFKYKEFDLRKSELKQNSSKIDIPKRFHKELIEEANEILSGNLRFFFDPNQIRKFDGFKDHRLSKHWIDELLNFDSMKDIKIEWEPSRFYWALVLARAYAVTLDASYLKKLNELYRQWTVFNPLNKGINWACGQEASYRVINTITVLDILDQKLTPGFSHFIELHLERIEKNIRYAISQDNNHGTSEASALYIGSSFLIEKFAEKKKYQKWKKKGLSLLKRQMKRLILNDGSFSMYSTNYHRVVMQTFSFVLYWDELLCLKSFTKSEKDSLCNLCDWMIKLFDKESTSAPNFGTNDGSYLLKLNSCDYRNFLPSIQVLYALLHKKVIFSEDMAEDLYWLSCDKFDLARVKARSSNLTDSGLLCFHCDYTFVMLRYSNFKFRPSHDDIGHIDFWLRGENIIRDSGTFTYNDSVSSSSYFSSSLAHSTLSVEQSPRMERMSRFLYLNWPSSKGAMETNQSGHIKYDDKYKFYRAIKLEENKLIISDCYEGEEGELVFIFHLGDGDWRKEGSSILGKGVHINFISEYPFSITLKKTEESLYYNRVSSRVTCEVFFNAGSHFELETEVHW